MTVELVIKIDDKYLKDIKECVKNGDINYEPWVAIANGTILPKGHGDLKDVDNLKREFVMWSMILQGNFTDAYIASIIHNSRTIIKADKIESEEKKNDEI